MEDLMIHCILENNIQKLIRIVENGANIHFQNDYPFILACSKGLISIVVLIINLFHPDINTQNGLPLRMACVYGHIDIVICLLENGADINADDGAALVWSAYKNWDNITKYLIEKGADKNVRNGILMRIYGERGNFEMVSYLMENNF